MNRRELRKQFGRNPSLSAVIVYAVQQALRPFGCNHGDPSRSRTARVARTGAVCNKAAEGTGPARTTA
jgi:hypothetical protein